MISSLLLLLSAVAAEPFALRDGDRVVLIGSTFVERLQDDGYLETVLVSRLLDRSITFRNLGWSGDNVFGEAQARFGTVAEGFKHRSEHVKALDPTVILVGYGANESFAGVAGLPAFEAGLNRLLDDLAPLKARVVLLAPLSHEAMGPPLPDPAEHLADLSRYRDRIRTIAGDRKLPFLDLLAWHQAALQKSPKAHLTENGIHLSPCGSWRLAQALSEMLGAATPETRPSTVTENGITLRSDHVRISKLDTNARRLRFEAASANLPAPPAPDAQCRDVAGETLTSVAIEGLPPGRYRVRVEGEAVGVIEGGKKAEITLDAGAEVRQAEELRKAITAKNTLYFHRWRPQNETYLFGFRKHEQGQNAVEVPRFDPLVAELESRIAVLRRPSSRTIEVAREEQAP